MGPRQVEQGVCCSTTSRSMRMRCVPADHLLCRSTALACWNCAASSRRSTARRGGHSDDPDVDRRQRRLCEEVHLNLAYRWFCRLGLDGDVPDHSTFSKNRHGRFRESDLLRRGLIRRRSRGWISAIGQHEALASINHSIVEVDKWEQAHFREDEIRSKEKAAKKRY